VLTHLNRLCHQFEAQHHPGAVPIEVTAVEGQFQLTVGGQDGGIRPTALRAAQRAEWWMMRLASRAEQDLIHLHGAVLSRNGRTLLVPGASGTGKSTFALAMTTHGFDLVADDISFADLDQSTLRGLQRAPHVHDDAIPLLTAAGFDYRPQQHLPGFLEVEAIENWHRGPSPLPSLILFVDWDNEGPPDHHAITHAEAAIELRRFSYNLKRQPDGGWSAARELLSDTRCMRLIRGPDLQLASRTVADLLAA